MRIQQPSRQGCAVLTLTGRLDLAAAPQVKRAILKQLAEQPPAIICDLGRVEAIDPLGAGVFASIRHPALGWPGTALVLSGAPVRWWPIPSCGRGRRTAWRCIPAWTRH